MDKLFYGSSFDLRAIELRSLRIDPEHRKGEADLVKSRWFDYCNMHPGMATYYYAHLYRKYTTSFHDSYVDIRTSEEANPFTPDDIFMSRDITSMWLARRVCDALGMPYEFALQFASDRALNHLFRRFPRPNQLYSEEFMIDLTEAWKENTGRSLRYSRLPRFGNKNYKGVGRQDEHRQYVIDQIKQRPAPHQNILARMFNEDVLDERAVEDHFSQDVIRKASEVALTLHNQSLLI